MLVKINNIIRKVFYYIFYKPIYQIFLKKLGKRSYIFKPLRMQGWENIEIGSNVIIGKHTWMEALPLTGVKPELIIGNNCRIGNFNHIYATKSIKINDDVLTADKVYISDNQHGYKDILTPIHLQPIIQLNIVEIGSGTWIGENACIMGVTIGKNCVIGANSIVKNDIPDYCVVVGSPAKIIKKYCIIKNQWLKTDLFGNFIN